MAKVKYLENIKTGVRFVPTEALMKRPDMRPIMDDEDDAQPDHFFEDDDVQGGIDMSEGDGSDDDLGDGVGTEAESEQDTDDESEVDGGEPASSWFDGLTEEQLIERGKDYDLKLTRSMKPETMIAHIEKAMGL